MGLIAWSGICGLVTSGEVRNEDLICVIDAGGEVRICNIPFF